MAYSAGASSGNLTLIQEQTASGAASIVFTSGIGSTYTDYALVLENISGSANGFNLALRVSANGGSSYASTGYNSSYTDYGSAGVGYGNVSTYFILASTVDSGTNISGTSRLFSLFNGSNPYITGSCAYVSSASCIGSSQGGFTTNTTINALQLLFTSGTITGTAKLYGIVN